MIDWTQPIELDTVPPRPAQMTAMRSWGTAEVDADWDADGVIYPLLVSGDGTTQIPGVPTVRNVTTAPDLAAELAEALRPFAAAAKRIEHYDSQHYDAPLFALREGGSLRELLDGIHGEPVRVQQLRCAAAALAKYEASK